MTFSGSTTKTACFLMQPVGPPEPFSSDEANAVRWPSLEEAETLIALTMIKTGRKRDKAVIDVVRAALAGWPTWGGESSERPNSLPGCPAPHHTKRSVRLASTISFWQGKRAPLACRMHSANRWRGR